MRLYRALPFVLVFLAGCGGPSLGGKWTASGGGVPAGAKSTIEFTDSTFKQTIEATQMGISLKIEANGTYTINDKKIKLTVNDLKLDDSQIPAAFKDQAKKQVEAGKGKTQEGDLKIDGDTATITSAGVTMTLTKVK